MDALVLEQKGVLRLRDIAIDEPLGPADVRVRIHTVGICGSDVHYYRHGAIGPFVVRAPLVLGHEASGGVLETGAAVTGLNAGDRVCMEPGVPDPQGRATRLGLYNLDPAMRFWATPPVHGCLRPTVVHPAALTFKLPDNVSFAEAAMVEPLAVGLQAATKARIKPGDVAVVLGAGPIGLVTALAAGLDALCPGGALVLIGMPGAPVPFDVVAAQVKEARIETIFRYAHVFPRALALLGSRKIDVRPLITDHYAFADSVAAFDYAANPKSTSVKVQIELP